MGSLNEPLPVTRKSAGNDVQWNISAAHKEGFLIPPGEGVIIGRMDVRSGPPSVNRTGGHLPSSFFRPSVPSFALSPSDSPS